MKPNETTKEEYITNKTINEYLTYKTVINQDGTVDKAKEIYFINK